MAVLVGQKAPSFDVSAVLNGNEVVESYSLDQFLGKKHVILFFYPKDFTFVCPTELHAFQARLADFEAKGVAIVACSTDTEESHWAWLQMAKNAGGIDGVTYPVVADKNKTISTNYDVLAGRYDYNDDGELISEGEMVAFRALFLIDKEGVVQHQVVNNLPLGRSVDEAMRMVDALQYFEAHGEVCPANWQVGDDTMVESHEAVADYLSKH